MQNKTLWFTKTLWSNKFSRAHTDIKKTPFLSIIKNGRKSFEQETKCSPTTLDWGTLKLFTANQDIIIICTEAKSYNVPQS